MPLHRRIPKRGFHNPGRKEFAVVNIASLNAFSAGETVTPDLLRDAEADSPRGRRNQGAG